MPPGQTQLPRGISAPPPLTQMLGNVPRSAKGCSPSPAPGHLMATSHGSPQAAVSREVRSVTRAASKSREPSPWSSSAGLTLCRCLALSPRGRPSPQNGVRPGADKAPCGLGTQRNQSGHLPLRLNSDKSLGLVTTGSPRATVPLRSYQDSRPSRLEMTTHGLMRTLPSDVKAPQHSARVLGRQASVSSATPGTPGHWDDRPAADGSTVILCTTSTNQRKPSPLNLTASREASPGRVMVLAPASQATGIGTPRDAHTKSASPRGRGHMHKPTHAALGSRLPLRLGATPNSPPQSWISKVHTQSISPRNETASRQASGALPRDHGAHRSRSPTQQSRSPPSSVSPSPNPWSSSPVIGLCTLASHSNAGNNASGVGTLGAQSTSATSLRSQHSGAALRLAGPGGGGGGSSSSTSQIHPHGQGSLGASSPRIAAGGGTPRVNNGLSVILGSSGTSASALPVASGSLHTGTAASSVPALGRGLVSPRASGASLASAAGGCSPSVPKGHTASSTSLTSGSYSPRTAGVTGSATPRLTGSTNINRLAGLPPGILEEPPLSLQPDFMNMVDRSIVVGAEISEICEESGDDSKRFITDVDECRDMPVLRWAPRTRCPSSAELQVLDRVVQRNERASRRAMEWAAKTLAVESFGSRGFPGNIFVDLGPEQDMEASSDSVLSLEDAAEFTVAPAGMNSSKSFKSGKLSPAMPEVLTSGQAPASAMTQPSVEVMRQAFQRRFNALMADAGSAAPIDDLEKQQALSLFHNSIPRSSARVHLIERVTNPVQWRQFRRVLEEGEGPFDLTFHCPAGGSVGTEAQIARLKEQGFTSQDVVSDSVGTGVAVALHAGIAHCRATPEDGLALCSMCVVMCSPCDLGSSAASTAGPSRVKNLTEYRIQDARRLYLAYVIHYRVLTEDSEEIHVRVQCAQKRAVERRHAAKKRQRAYLEERDTVVRNAIQRLLERCDSLESGASVDGVASLLPPGSSEAAAVLSMYLKAGGGAGKRTTGQSVRTGLEQASVIFIQNLGLFQDYCSRLDGIKDGLGHKCQRLREHVVWHTMRLPSGQVNESMSIEDHVRRIAQQGLDSRRCADSTEEDPCNGILASIAPTWTTAQCLHGRIAFILCLAKTRPNEWLGSSSVRVIERSCVLPLYVVIHAS